MTNAVAAALCTNDILKLAAKFKKDVDDRCAVLRPMLERARDPVHQRAIQEACDLLTAFKVEAGMLITDCGKLKAYIGAANMCGEIDRLEAAQRSSAAHREPETLVLKTP